MSRFIIPLAGVATAFSLAGAAFAGDQYVDGTGFAASGYDVVAYFDLSRTALGQSQPAGGPDNNRPSIEPAAALVRPIPNFASTAALK